MIMQLLHASGHVALRYNRALARLSLDNGDDLTLSNDIIEFDED
jgi:hypothetical protein